jgi:hypothetical protein
VRIPTDTLESERRRPRDRPLEAAAAQATRQVARVEARAP